MTRILLLDQEESRLTNLSQLLENFLSEHTVFQARGLREATRLTRREYPIVVFASIEMPEIENIIQQLRNSVQKTYLPIIGIRFVQTNYSQVPLSDNSSVSILEVDTILQLHPELFSLSESRASPAIEEIRNLISRLNKKMQMLTNTQVLLQEILNISPNFAFVKDEQGRYTFVNQKFLQIFERNNDRVIGKDITGILPDTPATREMHNKDMQILQGSISDLETEESYPDKQGNLYWANTIKRPLKNASGQINGIVGVSTDITQKKLAQEESKNLEQHLRRAQKMEAIGTLSSGIAHEFNNILSSVIGYTELAQLIGKKDSELEKYLEQVLTSADRAKTLVNQILAFVRQNEKEYKPLQIHLILKELIKFLRSTLPSSIALQQKINATGEVFADLTQINQLIMNLCTNAIQSMNNVGGGTLTLSLEQEEVEKDFYLNPYELLPGTYLKLAVTDTGEGIPSEQIQRIFDPYFSTKTEEQGTGLGLSILQGIVRNLGGEVQVESELGKGSTFSVYLPKIQSREQEEVFSGKEKDHLPQGTGHILFIDDEPELGDIGKKMLANLGYEVTYFCSGLEALGHFWQNSHEYELLFVDLFMPGMQGDLLAEEFRKIRTDIPIVLCTASQEYEYTEKNAHTCIDAYIGKPFKHKELAEVIKKAMKK